MCRIIRGLIAVIFVVAVTLQTQLFAESPASCEPRLVVLVVVDQMRADYLRHFANHFEAGGFGYLLEHGAFFADANVPYLSTETAPGHATIATGCWPSQHGIIANKWWKTPEAARLIAAVDDDVQQVGATSGKSAAGKGQSPRALLRPGIGDQMKLADPRSRVFSVSFKDRAAILLAGKTPDGVFWCDKPSGQFVTSSYYTERLPEYVAKLNAAGGLRAYAGRTWSALLPEQAYAGTRQCQSAWTEYLSKHEATLPHMLPVSGAQWDTAASERVLGSPFANEVVLGLAQSIMETEGLGLGPAADLLCISLSANDHIGHLYGPDSPEVMDITVRTDRQLARFFAFLDKRVGLQHCLLVLTADHGISTSAYVTRETRLGGGLFSEEEAAERLNKTLVDAMSDEKAARPLVSIVNTPWVFCSPEFEEIDRRLNGRLGQAARDCLRQLPGVERVFRSDELAAACGGGCDPDLTLAARSYYPGRSGQFCLLLKPFWQPFDKEDVAEHTGGSRSDRHVPIILCGPGVKVGTCHGPADLTDIAVTIAALLDIEPPVGAVGRVLSEGLDSTVVGGQR